MAKGEERHGVKLSSLDEPLFPDAGVPKRALIDYLEAMHDRIVPVLRDRPLSVIRTTGDEPFMQKNLPKYTPEWVARVSMWAEASHREVSYGLCNDLPTLLWFGNQRAVEYHPTLGRVPDIFHPTHLVLDLDPPEGADFAVVVAAARLIEPALDEVGLAGAVKTSGAKGIHIYVPVADGTAADDAAAATRAIAAAGRSPRPGSGHDRVPQGGPWRQGVPRRHPFGRRHRRGGLQPACPARRAGVVPGRLGSSSTTSGRATSRSPTSPIGWTVTTRGPTRCPTRRRSRPIS